MHRRLRELYLVSFRPCGVVKYANYRAGGTLQNPFLSTRKTPCKKQIDGYAPNVYLFFINLFCMMYDVRGNWEKKYFRKRASVAYTANTLVAEHSDDDTITPAVAGSTALVGIVMKTVASTDADYAENTRIPVLVPLDSSSEMMCDTNSDIAITDEGELHDLTDASLVDPAASTTDVLKLKQFVSARKGIYLINKKAFL